MSHVTHDLKLQHVVQYSETSNLRLVLNHNPSQIAANWFWFNALKCRETAKIGPQKIRPKICSTNKLSEFYEVTHNNSCDIHYRAGRKPGFLAQLTVSRRSKDGIFTVRGAARN